MKIFSALIAAFLAATISTSVFAETDEDIFLEGDVRLACEAILCLSAGAASGRPSECAPSIRKYFSIHRSKPHKTLRARLNFLRLCPETGEEHVQQAKNGADQMHVQQARNGADQMQNQRQRECSQECAKDEYGYEVEGGGLGCMPKCQNSW